MTLTTHVFTGAVIGRHVSSPTAAGIIAFLSHFILDMLPHWNPEYPTRRHITHTDALKHFLRLKVLIPVVLDLFAAIFVTIILVLFTPGREDRIVLIIAIGASVLPDIMDLLRFIKPLKSIIRPFVAVHDKVQYEVSDRIVGIITQGTVIIAAIIMDFTL